MTSNNISSRIIPNSYGAIGPLTSTLVGLDLWDVFVSQRMAEVFWRTSKDKNATLRMGME